MTPDPCVEDSGKYLFISNITIHHEGLPQQKFRLRFFSLRGKFQDCGENSFSWPKTPKIFTFFIWKNICDKILVLFDLFIKDFCLKLSKK